jgi:hypothetical protein
MRRDEEFVGRALVDFFGGPSYASVSDGDDPPDLYLTLGALRVGVEVTQLTQFTLEHDGTLGNRTTQDFFGLRLVDDLNIKVGPLVPDNISLLIGLWVPVLNSARFRKGLTDCVKEVALAPEKGMKQERKIEGSRLSISVIPEHPSGKKVVGFVVNTNSSADIGLNAQLVLEDRIRTKSEICAPLPKPVWLALLNDYWLADAETYDVAGQQLKLAHCFERIFLVSDIGAVSELAVGA